MTERDINGYCIALREAIGENKEVEAANCIVNLLNIALVDLHRIADALEIVTAASAHETMLKVREQ